MVDVLASMATNRSSSQVRSEISMAILKQQMDQQEMQAAALVEMIQNSSLDGTGQIVNTTA